MRLLWAGVLALLTATPALAECPPAETMAAAAEGWLAGERLPDPAVSSIQDAACAYNSYRAALQAELGEPVGYKVGFTSKPAQERFGVTAPVAGALFADMILQDGAEVSLQGSRSPFYEADLVVTVADEAINAAQTREDVARSLSDVRPFIELPDMALAEGVAPTGPIMAAYGVIPWRGVMGQGIALSDLSDPVRNLAELTVELRADGQSVAEGRGDMLLGHPLDVVLFLTRQGTTLEPGQVISLGSLSPLVEATPGIALSADYSIDGKPMTVSATLTD
ncbi:fumarylacetoacetate hydrolase family protein [uncultured Paracoccus sp.]|uniref:2-keto-4-pentenoate hydratase n=1 Tax=uncultured Paracoccus sp. TaxID=189685 RepID=UPI002607C45C|nr:fumarylacetoacetate hydrolase family protein [uncultured Paracoccus sp.]